MAHRTQGRTIGSPGFQEETRAYLQHRLRLLSGTLSLLLGALLTAFLIYSLLKPGDTPSVQRVINFVIGFPNSVLVVMVVTVTAIYTVLKQRVLSTFALAVADGVLLQALIVPCLVLYAKLHTFSFSGFAYVVPFIMLFLLARAILVPSNAGRTLLLSVPAALALFLIQLSYGASYAAPNQTYSTGHYFDTLVQNQICLLGSIAVAALASRINLSLRRRTYDARHVGQYRLGKMIGMGAMGEVYEATHSLLKRPTALKFLRPEISGAASLARFEHEVRQTSRLTHPNTISIFDYGHTADGVFYYAMELLDGADLREIVQSSGPLPPARIIHILSQACGALAEAHDKGMVHRDLKAANLMLCNQGGDWDVLKVLDFGLVKEVRTEDALTPKGAIVGTPETMAPEVVAGKGATTASDIYSLAAVAYYLATGRSVFPGETIPDVLRAHLHEAPFPPSQVVESVPKDLEAVILSGLSKDPSQRPESTRDFRRQLLSCGNAGEWTQLDAVAWWDDFKTRRKSVEPIDSEDRVSASTIDTLLIAPDDQGTDSPTTGI